MPEIIKSSKASSKRKTSNQYQNNDLLQHSKLPPQAVDIEEAVLGAMMLENNAVTTVIDILKSASFYKEAHQIIYEAIFNLFHSNQAIDILTVTNELKRTGRLDEVGGAYFITQLTNRVASSANIEFHARIIMQKFIQRELIRISTEIQRDAYADSTDVLELLDNAEKNLFSIGEDNLRRNWDTMAHLIKQVKEEMEEVRGREGGLIGIGTNFTKLDNITGGWQKSDLIIIAARPSMGKTAFTLSMARNIAVEFNKPVAFFSLEMSALQLVTRLIASETEIDSRKIKNGTLNHEEWNRLNEKINKLSEAPLFIDDTPALSIFELRAKSRRLKQQHDIQAIFIDYLQLMSAGNDNRWNREQEISNISRSLKSLAKELDIPVIVLSQLSRAVETRGNTKRPILSDLRESGAIEQDADIVCFIYRPKYYGFDKDDDNLPTDDLAEIIIAKHRNGAIGNVKLRFKENYAKFEDFDDNFFSGSYNGGIEKNDNFDNGLRTITRESKMNKSD